MMGGAAVLGFCRQMSNQPPDIRAPADTDLTVPQRKTDECAVASQRHAGAL